ncbi:MAG: SDR family oxidoreductase, partial [Bacteroidetes bacterium]|nr:SDR family oxidoreductase [Bacteroidota bacterium]
MKVLVLKTKSTVVVVLVSNHALAEVLAVHEKLLTRLRTGAGLLRRVYLAGADVGKSGDPKAIVDEVIKRHGRLDVVVNNAGTLTMGPVMELDDEEVERGFRTNVFAILAMSREALPHLIKTQGSIINISSTVSTSVMPGISVYAASKAAVDHITRTLAVESGPSGVRVNAVAPGLTATDMVAAASPDGQMQEMMVSQTPMGRVGEPQDISSVVRLLASDDAGWVT